MTALDPFARTQRLLGINEVLLNGKKANRRRLPRQIGPDMIAREYSLEIQEFVDLVEKAFEPVLSELPRLMESVQRELKRVDAGEGARLRLLIENARRQALTGLSEARIQQLAAKFAAQTQTWQRLQFLKQTRAAFGTDLVASSPRIGTILSNHVSQNAALIRNVPVKLLDDLESTILQGISTGRVRELEAVIDKKFKFGKTRSKLIARDQIRKLYSQVNTAVQQSVGVDRFIWRHSGSENPRPEHLARDGQVFSFDDPPSELPGELINCECHAEPVLSDLTR